MFFRPYPLFHIGLLVSFVAVWACSDPSDSGGPQAVGDGLTDTESVDGSTEEDHTAGDVAVGSDSTNGSDVAPGGTQPAPPAEPRVVPVGMWRAATLKNPNDPDPVLAAIEAGTFEFPETDDAYGLKWSNVRPAEDGTIDSQSWGYLQLLVAKIDLPETGGIIVQADRTFQVLSGQVRQPGDIYGSGRVRIPIPHSAGADWIVVRAQVGTALPKVVLTEWPHEVAFNDADMVAPDWVLGQNDPSYLGLPVLSFRDTSVNNLVAHVVENEYFEATQLPGPIVGAHCVTQVGFRLIPKEWTTREPQPVARLRLQSPDLQYYYEHEVSIPTVALDPANPQAIRQTFVSQMDRSIQFYGLRLPQNYDPARLYSLVLSLHGAGVEAGGQAAAYSPKNDSFLAAATNRRPFGFDWEVWGRVDAIEVLEEVQTRFATDPTRTYVTGHSMGGHGTWQIGVLFPDRFAVVGPSAGWISFETYGGPPFPTGPFGWARHSSDTLRYVDNLIPKAVYIIHGTADDTVPIAQAEQMFSVLSPIVPDLYFHRQPDGGHWWDGELSPGADCVDWPPLFDLMQKRTVNPDQLDFRFVGASPWVNPTHSVVTVLSKLTPAEDFVVDASVVGTDYVIETTNVRGMEVRTDTFEASGIQQLRVDGRTYPISGPVVSVGDTTGKRPGQHGPLNEVLEKPTCIVYPDNGSTVLREVAANLVSTWNVIGNGAMCTLPLSLLTDEVRANHNIVYMGVPQNQVPIPPSTQVTWTPQGISVAGTHYENAAAVVVFPEGNGLSAAFYAAQGKENLLFRLQPFTSRFVVPDFLVWDERGARTVGFFNGNWEYEPTFSQ